MRLSKIIIIIALRSLLFIFTFLTLALLSKKNLSELAMWWSIICCFCNIITIILLLWLTHSQNKTYKQLINYHKGQIQLKSIIYGVIVILIIGLGGMFLAGYIMYGKLPYLAPMLIHPIPVILAIINLFILPVTTTLAEDGLYLGYGVNSIRNKWLAIFIPALFYALQHSFMPLLWDSKYLIYRFLSFLPLTILLGYWYEKKRDPVPIMVGHFVINLATVIQILMMSLFPEIYSTFLS